MRRACTSSIKPSSTIFRCHPQSRLAGVIVISIRPPVRITRRSSSRKMSCAVGSSINTSSIVAPCSASGPWFVVRKRKTQPQCVITAGLSLPYPLRTLKFDDLGLIQSGGHKS